MKTSSKILTGFFIIVFLVPIAMFMSFKSKIKKGQYTLVRNDSFQSINSRKGDIASFKVIKLVGAKGNNLKVNLSVANTACYKYSVDGSDSVKIYHSADTVFIQSVGEAKESQDDHFQNDVWVDLSLPSLEGIVVDNAEAFINANDSSAFNRVDIILNENSLLSIGRHENYSRNDSEASLKIDQLAVKANGSRFFIGKNVSVSRVQLETNGSADVTISDGAMVNEVMGSLSDSSSVKANWKYLKQLTGLDRP
ncbi:hypothetical protein [Terrimonas pollutisoli]|uniref:hypothetical protein n=1 Tax=Terrimonas pollutisoli TaxID=3034147 RepID=UPI0023EB4CA6|nr:hypothetical protein [Terrimonas sp. H1YJ31]